MLKRYFRNSIVLLVLVGTASTAAGARQVRERREPIVISAHRLDADKLGDKVTFRGEVTLKKEGMTVSSDTMVVYYDARSKGIREIEAVGNVMVRKDGRVAYSKKASYFSRDEKIVLTGDARIVENENQLGGDRITLFMRDDRSIVEGGRVLFYQDNQKPEGGKRP
jgi:lipopolysaccharide export system protein LptA